MKQFEYKCVFIWGAGEKTTRILNEYGREGWDSLQDDETNENPLPPCRAGAAGESEAGRTGRLARKDLSDAE